MKENDYQKLRLALFGAAGVIKLLSRNNPIPADEMLEQICDAIEVLERCKNESAAAS